LNELYQENIMAKPSQPDKVLAKKENKKLFKDLLLTETLRAELMGKYVFKNNTIEELFMVSNNVKKQFIVTSV